MGKIKVLIVDNISIIRNGLKVILEKDNNIEVINIVENDIETYEQCKKYKPDIVIISYSSVNIIQYIKKEMLDIKIIVTSMNTNENIINKAINIGVDGYISIEIDDIKIINTVKRVYEGLRIFSREYNKTTEFTNREKDVLKLIAQGYTNKGIAEQLYLTEGTVRNLVSKILDKLVLKDRTQVAVYAVKHGLD